MDISVDRLMEFYLDTLDKCGMCLLEMCDEDIEYNIFEEFDVGAVSFLHEDTLSKLLSAGLINDNILYKSSVLRNNYLKLQGSNLWNINSIKHASKWKDLFKLSDEIKSDISELSK